MPRIPVWVKGLDGIPDDYKKRERERERERERSFGMEWTGGKKNAQDRFGHGQMEVLGHIKVEIWNWSLKHRTVPQKRQLSWT